MINPKIDLENVARHLESVGFERVTKVLFQRGFVVIKIKDALVPDGLTLSEIPDPFFVVEIYSEGSELVGVMVGTGIELLKNTQT